MSYNLIIGATVKKLFNINFYKNRQGRQPVKEYIDDLRSKAEKSKDSRLKLKKIFEYIEILSRYGTKVGAPYIKHINGDIWELRPLNDRIFFFYWKGDGFILLHHFKKKTQKTPSKEIDQAERNKQDFITRSSDHEK